MDKVLLYLQSFISLIAALAVIGGAIYAAYKRSNGNIVELSAEIVDTVQQPDFVKALEQAHKSVPPEIAEQMLKAIPPDAGDKLFVLLETVSNLAKQVLDQQKRE